MIDQILQLGLGASRGKKEDEKDILPSLSCTGYRFHQRLRMVEHLLAPKQS